MIDPAIRQWLEQQIEYVQNDLLRDCSPNTRGELGACLHFLQEALQCEHVDAHFCETIFTAGWCRGPTCLRDADRIAKRFLANARVDDICDRIETLMVTENMSFDAARRSVGRELDISERQMIRIIKRADFDSRGKLF